MSDKPGWGLVFAFPDQSPSFSRGFACGRLWQRMRTESGPIEETVAAELRETVIAMATAAGWDERIVEIADGWVNVTLTRAVG